MKKVLSLLALLVLCTVCLAQTVTLTFTGRDTNNQYVQLSRVEIENVSQNWQETLTYPDTVLTMGKVGIDSYDWDNAFTLFQNNPNPFDVITYVAVQTIESGELLFSLSDINGRTVETLRVQSLQPGTHQFRLQVANVGTYLLTARQNGKVASVKMMNSGKGAANKIEYMGTVETQNLLSLPVKNTKGKTDNLFAEGDEMVYTGYATVNGKEYQSLVVRQKQYDSEDFTLQFSIAPEATLPVVLTDSVSNITETSANCAGTVTDDGGVEITERGICYSTVTEPTVSDIKVVSTDTVSTFTCVLTGLTAGTTYHVRAYATNSVGTAYGNEVTFTTSLIIVDMPVVITTDVEEITGTSAVCGGVITADGGARITERGICYSTIPEPTLADVKVMSKDTVNTFTCAMTGLTSGTAYYVRAYATNSAGTAYGNQISFETTAPYNENDGQPCPGKPTVTDHEGNVYNTVQVGHQCWTKENMRCTTSPSTGTYLVRKDVPSSSLYSYSGKQARWLNNDSTTYAPKGYGLLYNWNAAVDTFNTTTGTDELDINTNSSASVSVVFSGHRRGICPKGWHVPSDADWEQLAKYVGSQTIYQCGEYNDIARALASTEGWNSYEEPCAVGYEPSGNNATGFTATPAGAYGASFGNTGTYAYCWSATQGVNKFFAGHMGMNCNSASVSLLNKSKNAGFSVRCLMD